MEVISLASCSLVIPQVSITACFFLCIPCDLITALTGHAGAHTCMLAFSASLNSTADAVTSSKIAYHRDCHASKIIAPERLPTAVMLENVKVIIGLSGPYDIADHFDYESKRVMGPIKGVAWCSPMQPVSNHLSSPTLPGS
jgi:hypothetical protein